jgi:hypothetical protein
MIFYQQRFTLLLLMLCLSAGLMAQDRTITGLVTDENQQPLIGANVLIPGTGTGASTDLDGKFTLEVPESITQLEVSYIALTIKG